MLCLALTFTVSARLFLLLERLFFTLFGHYFYNILQIYRVAVGVRYARVCGFCNIKIVDFFLFGWTV
jgi:hypothetical protein